MVQPNAYTQNFYMKYEYEKRETDFAPSHLRLLGACDEAHINKQIIASFSISTEIK